MLLSKILRRSVCALAACAICFSTAAASGLGSGTVTASAINMRNGASLSASIISTAKNGTKVEVIDQVSDWYKVNLNGVSGYMHSDYVKLEEAEETIDTVYAMVTGSNVRIRKGPSTNDEIIDELGVGTKVTVIDQADGWTHVYHDELGEGYISSDYLRMYNPTVTDDELSSEIINFAMELLGVPYVYGGTSTSGFDCSGFVYYVFNNFGYSLYRVAADQYNNNGVYVAREDLLPGDLVFFSYGSESIGHVGIYIGDDEFIHASSGSAYSVTIDSLASSNYNRRYAGAKRVI